LGSWDEEKDTMKKNWNNIYTNKIFPIIFGIIITGCQIRENIPSSIPNLNTSTIEESTPILLPSMELIIPSVSPRKTIDPTKTSTPVILPPPGEYIAYSYGKSINLVSVTGKEAGILMEGAREGRNWLSPNQEIIAYSDEPHIIHFTNIYTGATITYSEQETCRFGVTSLSWNPKGNQIVVSCSYALNRNSLNILTFPEGEIVGRIEKIIEENINVENYHYDPIWSPDGKWIAFFIRTGNPSYGEKGPFITDMSCLSDGTVCADKTYLILNNPYSPISWTPDSNLATLDTNKYSINLYKMPFFSLIQTIKIPDDYWGLDTFTWSHNNEWFAIDTMDGIFIMSSKTGEIRQIRSQGAELLFWLEIK